METQFKPPYKKDAKTNFTEFIGKPGVYIIKKNDEILYVGMSKTNVYKTMLRHFQEWNDPTQYRVVYKYLKDITVKVKQTTAKQAEIEEKRLIKKLNPRDNRKIIELTKAEIKKYSKGVPKIRTDIPF